MNNNMFFIENSGAKMKIALGYNEKKKCITAVPITIVGDMEIKGRTISNLDLILELLHALTRQSKKSLSTLVDENSIVFNNNHLIDDGVIITDKNGEYHKIVFDKQNSEFKEKIISRKERKELGLLVEIDDLDEDKDAYSIVETKEINEDEELTELMDIAEIVNEIKRLNPEAEIELGDKDSDPLYSTRFFSSIPAFDLKLPKGFYYNDKNGITNKHHTASGHYVFFDVEPLVKKESPKVETSVSAEETKESSIESDGAIEVDGTVSEHVEERTSESESKGKKKSVIRGLKIGAGALALIATGVILLHSCDSLFKNKNNDDSNNKNDNNNNNQYEDSIDDNLTVASLSDEEVITNASLQNTNGAGRYLEYGSEIYEEDMETQLDLINAECFTFEPRQLHNLVYEPDKQTINVISNARNNALTNRYDVVEIIDWYVKYVFEGSTMFDGKAVKAFDYLSPYAKYIVLVSGESLLALCPDYNYSTAYNENGYDYDGLIEAYDILVDRTYRELTGKSMTR